MSDTGELKNLPLKDLHDGAGARFGPFAGWSMPISYRPGVLKEHLHTREQAGLFDISHMQLFELSGAGAADLMSHACPLDAASLPLGRSKYTILLNDAAGIIDDVIVTRLGPERFIMVANAGNAATVESHLQTITPGHACTLRKRDRVLLALQGPAAESVLVGAGHDYSALAFMQALEPRANWLVTRSGYTGEDGFEIAVPVEEAESLATGLLADERVMWVGLAARDSLRLEAGLCLHGQDIDDSIDPVSARLLWAISISQRQNGRFVGADALRELIAAPRERVRVGLKPEGRQPVRAGARLFGANDTEIGLVTSGGFGPSAGHPVAMGYVVADQARPGTLLSAEIRGNHVPISVHQLPFMPHRYHKG